MSKIIVTKEDQKVIRALHRLEKIWPDNLKLFSWSGNLGLFKRSEDNDYDWACLDESFGGIDNDGGDPCQEVDQNPDIEYE